jgi:hypothetical protein
MEALKSKAGLTVAKIYLLLVLAALVFAVIALKKTAFAGLYLMLLTIPWSFITTELLDSFHIQDSVPILVKLGILLLAAVLNAIILYCIGAMIEKTKIKNNDKWSQL